MIKFVNDLGQVDGFLRGYSFSSTNKNDCHDITEILLKVALNTITLTHIFVADLRLDNINRKLRDLVSIWIL